MGVALQASTFGGTRRQHLTMPALRETRRAFRFCESNSGSRGLSLPGDLCVCHLQLNHVFLSTRTHRHTYTCVKLEEKQENGERRHRHIGYPRGNIRCLVHTLPWTQHLLRPYSLWLNRMHGLCSHRSLLPVPGPPPPANPKPLLFPNIPHNGMVFFLEKILNVVSYPLYSLLSSLFMIKRPSISFFFF